MFNVTFDTLALTLRAAYKVLSDWRPIRGAIRRRNSARQGYLMRYGWIVLATAAVLAPAIGLPAAQSGSDEKSAAQESVRKKNRATERAYGREGDPKKVKRVIRVDTSDAMRYFPDQVKVKKGDTVRFLVRNGGELPHAMVIGTMDDLKRHAKHARQHAGEVHDDANMVRVEPGDAGRIVWQFTRAGEFYYGCLIPGHFAAGMIGTIVVR